MVTSSLPVSTTHSTSSSACCADRKVSTSTAECSPCTSVTVLATHARCSLPLGTPCVELARFFVRSFQLSLEVGIGLPFYESQLRQLNDVVVQAIARTMRKRALPLNILAYASAAFSNGSTSVSGVTPHSELKRRV